MDFINTDHYIKLEFVLQTDKTDMVGSVHQANNNVNV